MNAPIIKTAAGKYAGHTLSDRYQQIQGRVLLTGIQALVRLPIDQARSDRQNGLRTAGFISGYRGSPLGGYDRELWHQQTLLQQHNIRFQPGLNEDLAATMVWGTQQAQAFPGSRFDGVFGLWYGKGPGLDRSTDALRHANSYGTAALGGVLACVGDDHTAQSSIFPHQSDHILEAVMMPTLSPASIDEYLTLGLAGYAMSRFCGLWTGFKTVTEVVESGRTVTLSATPHFILPPDITLSPHGLNADPHLAWPQERAELERRVVDERLPAALAFARVNQFNRIVYGCPKPRIAFVTVGKAHLDTLRALREMGISEADANTLGIAIYRMAMTWPIEPEGLRHLASGLAGLLVVEEKRSFVERQIKDLLYHLPADQRPVVAGKALPTGEPLLPDVSDLSPAAVSQAIARFLQMLRIDDARINQQAAQKPALPGANETISGLLARKPFFCSGCPHNTSTNVPDGSFATAGIGCHVMALGEARNTRTWCQMGGEGAQWVGLSGFTDMPHLFANMGDGTYQHSGLLAIRQAVIAKVSMTFKLLYNDAVAMTGGQAPDGHPNVFQIAAQIAAEGVTNLSVVTDEPGKYAGFGTFPAGVTIHHRHELDTLQRQYRDLPGVSVIIYDQTCAAEKRRRRKRQKQELPVRAFINERVCEGCGDCQKTSNCIAVEPSETDQGRKRRINQTACNGDLSCIDGFCPSFVTIADASPRKPDTDQLTEIEADYATRLTEPIFAGTLDQPYRVLVTGIGGSGIVTIGAILAMAAHLENKAAECLNFTGLSQKNGAVVSHLQIALHDSSLDVARIHQGQADLMLACDLAVAASPMARPLCDKMRTAIIANVNLTPTADFVNQPDILLDADLHRGALARVSNDAQSSYVEAMHLAEALFGDSTFSGILLLGLAYQRGLIPVGAAAIERAIDLNGVAVELNHRAFLWGRIFAAMPEAMTSYLGTAIAHQATLSEIIAVNRADLVAYQNKALAKRYERQIARIATIEKTLQGEAGRLTETVAKALYKLLAYKDEYEVARLYTDGTFLKQLGATFDNHTQLTFHMAPPLLAPRDPATGKRRKIKLNGRWVMLLLQLLKYGKVLRGTVFDPFGWQSDRRLERQQVREYEADLELIALNLSSQNMKAAIALAAIPLQIRGFGHIKEASALEAERRRRTLREALVATEIQQVPARCA
ncbi:indolepyruvate ferredoxin oxidoreductase family protein [Dongia soli]|uniref:Indolepyruvate ferredoxin oxidoreductase family protein n=1 Tax=Dongia soli TaxID=600628 RepID=A0ABU5E952_9PROT|nr:indolepyruvate ferredoxin oxidoreductase family protein [Dongia soli]MDY0882749.1 indolepyruvate ferredoxin oxidoreductase family protein [Dongia soli]